MHKAEVLFRTTTYPSNAIFIEVCRTAALFLSIVGSLHSGTTTTITITINTNISINSPSSPSSTPKYGHRRNPWQQPSQASYRTSRPPSIAKSTPLQAVWLRRSYPATCQVRPIDPQNRQGGEANKLTGQRIHLHPGRK